MDFHSCTALQSGAVVGFYGCILCAVDSSAVFAFPLRSVEKNQYDKETVIFSSLCHYEIKRYVPNTGRYLYLVFFAGAYAAPAPGAGYDPERCAAGA